MIFPPNAVESIVVSVLYELFWFIVYSLMIIILSPCLNISMHITFAWVKLLIRMQYFEHPWATLCRFEEKVLGAEYIVQLVHGKSYYYTGNMVLPSLQLW